MPARYPARPVRLRPASAAPARPVVSVVRAAHLPSGGTMNKAELVSAVAEKTGQSQSAVNEVLGALEDVITSEVASGGKVSLPGFLTFERGERAARTGRNPATGETIQIAASRVPKVKVGKSFKDAVK
ncbi:MAG TPA: HU family DNA-binding protein [Acidimicrobiales bacterium]|nr:HU family DNA-binding protein [Acidimicrobiales bacterium]